jgi:hypothetical protein
MSIDKLLASLTGRCFDAEQKPLEGMLSAAGRKYMTAQRYKRDGKIDETTFTFVEEQFFTVRRIYMHRFGLCEATGH